MLEKRPSNPESMLLNRRQCRSIVIVLFCLMLNACANIKRIIPISELTPEDLEPRVSFVDNDAIEVEPSEVKAIEAEKVIASYERLLTRGNPAIRKEALHRLADLTMRLAEAKMSFEESGQVDKITPAMASSSFAKAIALYQNLIQEFPDYPASDEVKYQLARAHSLNASPEQSLQILDQIAVVHSESVSYVESQFRRGESYFVRKEYRVAEQAYSEVILKGANTDFYDKALYKRGWSLFKQSLFIEAQKDFFQLYERLQYQISQGLSKDSLDGDLLADTRRVISMGFYNVDGSDSIKEYFQTNGSKDYENEIYAELATLYVDKERYQEAASTYQAFIDIHPLSLFAPEYHTRMIQIYHQGGFPSLILPAKESFVVNYGRNSEFWKTYNGKVIDDLKPLLVEHLDDISKFYHAKAQVSKKAEDYLVAAKWYREILATFEDQTVDSKYRFLLAESLYDGGDLSAAATEYEVVAYQNEKGEFSRDAGYRALVVYQEIKHPQSATSVEKLKPSIDSGLRFVLNFGDDDKAPEILARVAEQQLMINDIEGAIESSSHLLVLPAKVTNKQSERARIIIANGLFDLKKYAEAEVAITQLLETVSLSRAERTSFENRRVEAIYKLAEQAKSEQQLDQAISLFLKVKSLAPESKVAINAHFDAATLLLQTNQWDQASELLESFRLKYPKHELTQSIPEKLALVYENQSDWNKAAKEYLTLAQNQNDPEIAREGHWKVAELYLKAENRSKAIDSFKHYVWTYPEPYLLAQEGRNHLVDLYQKAGDAEKSMFWRQKIVEFYKKYPNENNNRTAYLAAENQYILSEPTFVEFKKIKLTLPLQNSLKKKRAAMKNALNAYNSIAQFNVAKFTTASTHRVAEIYHLLSKDLLNSQRPKGLDEDELEEYGYLLEEQALPFEDKAIEFYQINAQRTAEKIYDESVKQSIEVLKTLKPAHYDKSEKLVESQDVHF